MTGGRSHGSSWGKGHWRREGSGEPLSGRIRLVWLTLRLIPPDRRGRHPAEAGQRQDGGKRDLTCAPHMINTNNSTLDREVKGNVGATHSTPEKVNLLRIHLSQPLTRTGLEYDALSESGSGRMSMMMMMRG